MSDAVILDENDVRQLIADDYGVSLDDATKGQDIYVVRLKGGGADGLDH